MVYRRAWAQRAHERMNWLCFATVLVAPRAQVRPGGVLTPSPL
jgi:hypothetical protein